MIIKYVDGDESRIKWSHGVELNGGEWKFADLVDLIDAYEAEPIKHGKWIKNEAESALHVEPIYDCSACHNWQAWGDYECTPYCPNCGAKMDLTE